MGPGSCGPPLFLGPFVESTADHGMPERGVDVLKLRVFLLSINMAQQEPLATTSHQRSRRRAPRERTIGDPRYLVGGWGASGGGAG